MNKQQEHYKWKYHMWVKEGGISIPPFSPSYFNSSCTATRLFISVTRMVIGADGVTSHWGEMELKICPDGQNKGFGQKSGKRRKEGDIRKRRCGGGGGGDGAGGRGWKTEGGEKTGTKRNKKIIRKWKTRDAGEVYCVFYCSFMDNRVVHAIIGMTCWTQTPSSASLTKSISSDYTQSN